LLLNFFKVFIMKKKVYIIGSIPSVITEECELKFHKAEVQLIIMGFEVINPLTRLLCNDSYDDAKRLNINDLVLSDMAYILPCVALDKRNNIELKLALDFNLTIIAGIVNLDETEIHLNSVQPIMVGDKLHSA